jgi:hypothetical protein
MTIILIILLILLVIYLYWQNRKLQASNGGGDSSLVFDSEPEELIAERDQAIRTKNEAQAEALALNNRLKNKQQEVSRKEQEIERLKSEKNLVEVNLNKRITELKSQHTEQLRSINCLFDEQAKNYPSIDFEGLYALLTKMAHKNLPGSFPKGE